MPAAAWYFTLRFFVLEVQARLLLAARPVNKRRRKRATSENAAVRRAAEKGGSEKGEEAEARRKDGDVESPNIQVQQAPPKASLIELLDTIRDLYDLQNWRGVLALEVKLMDYDT